MEECIVWCGTQEKEQTCVTACADVTTFDEHLYCGMSICVEAQLCLKAEGSSCNENTCYDFYKKVGAKYGDICKAGDLYQDPAGPFCTKWIDYNGSAMSIAVSLLLLLIGML
jgi:hypothetical protein